MRVFILCPSKLATGGTELLHQFSKCLKERNVQCYMIYLGGSDLECPTPETFAKYDVKYVSQYIDASDSILVLPESQVHMVDICQKGTVMLWWLSVDNYTYAYREEIPKYGMDVYSLKDRKNVMHFVQSQYAKEFLRTQIGIDNTYYLKDYINDDIVMCAKEFKDKVVRNNYCLYNPAKGYQNIKPIIESCRQDITWVPLQGLKPEEMAYLMCSAKVYIDFGNHPGKDRIPREAGICGCCVITNRMGSAAYQEDVNIPEKFKMADMTDMEAILDIIYDCIDNYEERQIEYEAYRENIACEKEEFMQDIDKSLERMRQMAESRADGKEISIDAQHIDMLETLKQFAEEIAFRLNDTKAMVTSNNQAGLINSLLDVDYLLQVMKEGICYEEVSVVEN